MPASKQFVTVASFTTIVEAEAVRGVLESEGIPALVTDANLVSMNPTFGPAIGGVGLQVRAADAERALAIVREHEAEARREVVEDVLVERSETACLACGAEFPEYLERCPACGLSYS